jgi:predicted dithiol-disulfide oxidoreductase (DUF899 family)
MESSTFIDDQIEKLESELMVKQDELAALRRQLPQQAVEDYAFVGASGERALLSSFFGDADDLIVIHNMGARCSYCTLWADGLNGWLPHLESRAALVVVSPDEPKVQQAIAEKRNWRFRMFSDAEGRFTEDMGFIREDEGKLGPWPGFSTFHRDRENRIVRIAHDSFGPGDSYCGVWHIFGLLDRGVNGWEPRLHYGDRG